MADSICYYICKSKLDFVIKGSLQQMILKLTVMKSVDLRLKQHSRWSLAALLPVLRSSEQLTQGHTAQGCVRKAALFCQLPADNLVTWCILPHFHPPWVWRGTHTRLNDYLWMCSLNQCTWRNKSKQTHRDTLKDTFSRSREEKKPLKRGVWALECGEHSEMCCYFIHLVYLTTLLTDKRHLLCNTGWAVSASS